MFNLNQQMAQAQLTFLEQNVAASNFAIQQLRMALGLTSQGPYSSPFNAGMGNMGGGYSQPNFGQQQRRQSYQTHLTSWVVDIQVNPSAPQQLRITHASGQGVNTVAVVLREDYMQVSSNSGTVGQQITGYLAANAQFQNELMGWIFTDNQTLLTVPGVGSALFDTAFVQSLSNVRLEDLRIKEKPKAEPTPEALWIDVLKASPDNEYFTAELVNLGDHPSPNNFTTGYRQKRTLERYTRHGLLELGMQVNDLVSMQIYTLIAEGHLTSSLVKAWRLDNDHVLVSVKSIGLMILTTNILEVLHESIEVVDLRPTATAATIQVPVGTIDPLQRGPIGGHETGLSIEDIRGMAEESANAQAQSEPTPETQNTFVTTSGYSYNPENRIDELGGLNIDDVEFVGTAKTSFHQQFKFTFQHPVSRKLFVGVNPDQLQEMVNTEFTSITNRGLAVLIGKQNKIKSDTPQRAVITLVTFEQSDIAIVQFVSEVTRTYTLSKENAKHAISKFNDDTRLRVFHVA